MLFKNSATIKGDGIKLNQEPVMSFMKPGINASIHEWSDMRVHVALQFTGVLLISSQPFRNSHPAIIKQYQSNKESKPSIDPRFYEITGHADSEQSFIKSVISENLLIQDLLLTTITF